MQYPMGKQLRTARRAQALTQRQLADRAGMHIVTSSRLEHGTSAHIDAYTLGELAVALGVSADYLFGLQDAGAPSTTAPAPPAKPKRQRTRNAQPVG